MMILIMFLVMEFLDFALLRSTRHRDGARMSTGRNTAVGTRGDGATASGVLLENTLEVVIGIVVELGGGSVTVSRLGSSRKRRRVGGIVVDRHFFWRKGIVGFF